MLAVSDGWEHIIIGVSSVVSTGALLKGAQYVAKAVPALPKDAGWWAQFGYALLKGVSGLDPNTVSLKPYDGTTDRRAAAPQA